MVKQQQIRRNDREEPAGDHNWCMKKHLMRTTWFLLFIAQKQKKSWSIRTKTSRHRDSFFPSAVGLINRARDPH